MKKYVVLLYILFANNAVTQTLPVFPLKTAEKPKTVKASVQKDVKNSGNVTIKFLSDVDAKLYIDGEMKGVLKKEIPYKVKLGRSDYVFDVVSIDNEKDYKKWKYSVDEAKGEKLVEVFLLPVINQRLNDESVAAAKAKSEALEFNFSDNFSDNKNNWSLSSNENRKQYIENGKCFIVGLSDKFSYRSDRLFELDLIKNISYSVDVKHIDGGDHNGFGIDFCSDKDNPIYSFLITANGSYQIVRLMNGSWTDLKGWTKSASINQGNMLNILMIKKEGRYISFFINDNKVETLPFDGDLGKWFGLRASNIQTIEFDNFELKGSKAN